MSGADVMDDLAWLGEWIQNSQAKGGEAAFEAVRAVRANVAELLAEHLRLKAELADATGATVKQAGSAVEIEGARKEIHAAARELDDMTGLDDQQANALGCAENALSRALAALEGSPAPALKAPAADPAATVRWQFIAQAFNSSKTSASQRFLEAIGLPYDEAFNPLAWHIDRAISRQIAASGEQVPA